MARVPVLSFLLALLLASCSGARTAAPPHIEDCTWQMTAIQSTQAGGQIVACGPGEQAVPDGTAELLLYCTAEDGTLALEDRTGDRACAGTYEQVKTGRQEVLYAVSVDGAQGMAITAMTTYQDGSQTPTLILQLEDYVLNFFPAAG